MRKTADAIYLAPDPDREGEAIAWHLAANWRQRRRQEQEKARPASRRVSFNEITKRAVQEAFQHPRDIDQNLVDAQQTRRVLDRIVGYQVSPLFWDKVRRGLSAGRVQTVLCGSSSNASARSRLSSSENTGRWTRICKGRSLRPSTRVWWESNPKKTPIPNEEAAKLLERPLQDADWTVRSVEKRETPPQCRCAVHHQQVPAGCVAQAGHEREARHDDRATALRRCRPRRREGTVGLITYMRTDSTRVSNDALAEVRELIEQRLRKGVSARSAERLQVQEQGAQEAHEAIRPTAVAASS